MNFSTKIEEIPRVGTVYGKRLKAMGIKTLADLIYYFPREYKDFSKISKIKDIKINEKACVQGKIISLEQNKTWVKRMIITTALIQDDTGAIEAVWFNQPYIGKILKVGDEIILAGKLSFQNRTIQLSSPIYEKISLKETVHLGRIMSVYIESQNVSSKYLRYILKPIIENIKNKVPETLPEEILKKYELLPLKKALEQIHFPDSLELAKKAEERFSFEQIFFISLFNLRKKLEIKKEESQAIPINKELIERVKASLPFELTKAQKKTLNEILKDMENPNPMNRLLQGDVGSGKTAVAALASINAVKAKTQVVLMAPTEILVKQHFKTFFQMLKNFNLNVGLLTGKEDKYYSKKLHSDTIEISRNKLLEKVENGDIDILIGTQALIVSSKKKKEEQKVKFKNLGLVIVDEQHRFGVKQRAALSKKYDNKIPHLLSMTATPIPRTLALTVWGDLDLSIIDEMPKNRKKIITEIVSEKQRIKKYEFIKKEISKGGQVFVVCPRIESEKEEEEIKTVKKEYNYLSRDVFPESKLAMLHGKMTSKEKDKTMKDFRSKKYDILVSTSVIEVGIDIPNATVMMIEGSDRFGLAQLHQFRGRVGRGNQQSYCLLFTDSKSKKTRERLEAMIKYDNGFKLSEMDLKLRGPGDFFGVRQWGLPDFAMSALKDLNSIKRAREAAEEAFPQIEKNPLLKRRLEAFEEKVHLE
ncbi:MAG TPA: ATP-dependent DNA helicase RecG [Candidatus Pacearchaeota archaeon]|nr:ATP-dependent DNA helicase RecG [Candidatus Pacearchaeota archaeon]HPR79700.1 ATP-dependent DNA helicase RecG [Candidatus Pacearchaeota archaeon]